FRVLIIGRPNAGMTSILRRLCDTKDSPVVWRGNEEVQRGFERGGHSIEDELVFRNHDGYIFHYFRGSEAGSNEELGIVLGFIRQRSGKRQLQDRLHAIWFALSMFTVVTANNHDLKVLLMHQSQVPVIAVFTKYDQFLRNVKMHLEDYGSPDDNISDAAERQFKERYLRHLGDGVRPCANIIVKEMHKPETRCNALLEETIEALNE
ncbi:hypothetical protein BJY52DRAFT_1098851, partial [Lactarius psammicola]